MGEKWRMRKTAYYRRSWKRMKNWVCYRKRMKSLGGKWRKKRKTACYRRNWKKMKNWVCYRKRRKSLGE